MSNIIYEYRLDNDGTKSVVVPEGSTVLCVQVQNDAPYVWINIEKEGENLRVFNFRTILTGQPFEQSIREVYLETVQVGWVVLHVYVSEDYPTLEQERSHYVL
mgnify:CR=1 FL=1